MATPQVEYDAQRVNPTPETDIRATKPSCTPMPISVAKPTTSSKPKWYGMVLTVLGLLTLIGKAILVDCQAAKALAEVWRHLHHFGF